MTEIVTLLGTATGAVAIKSIFDIVLKRMSKREAESVAAQQDAAALDIIMSTWMSTVLKPTLKRAEDAEAGIEALRRRMDRMETAAVRHERWDIEAVRALREAGINLNEPPSLRFAPD